MAGGRQVSERTKSDLLSDLETLRLSQGALRDRFGRMLTAMAMSEDLNADLHRRLHALDDPPNGHAEAAALAAERAQTYRQILSSMP
jgi:hypothetical protein